jgi:3',5'-nucleoside bisphosphate phosphatase
VTSLPVDLHIHSCLSPCADEDMTPNNIAAMAHLKSLAAIAVCDHNSGLNALACTRAAGKFGILAIPGVEATTAEEIHALCYFPDIPRLLDFCTLLESRQSFVPNKPELLGEQVIMDEDDNITRTCPRWLGQACSLSIEEMELEVLKRGGVLVPAHINRPSQSLLANLGFIPPALHARTMEVRGAFDLPAGYRAIRSSDAHCLGEILEEGFMLQVEQNSIESIIDALKG